MIRTAVYVGASVDGYIARVDGEVDFLDSADPIDDDMGFAEFLESVDVLVMGRNTYDKVMEWVSTGDVEWPYGDMPVIVLTSRSLDVPSALAETVEPSSLPPDELLSQLDSRGFELAYVDGGRTVQTFLRAGLIDTLIVTNVPVLIGSGIPLFGELTADIGLRHTSTVAYENGCVQTAYAIDRTD